MPIIDIKPVIDGAMRFPAYWTMPTPGDSEYQQHADYLTVDRLTTYAVGGFLVVTSDRRILVDVGLGPSNGPRGLASPADASIFESLRRFWEDRYYPAGAVAQQMAMNLPRCELSSGALPASLHGLGLEPSDITDVVLSHLHFDHIGWVSVEGEPFFPRATYWIPQADLDHFLNPSALDETFFTHLFGARPTREVIDPVLPRVESWSGQVNLTSGVDLEVVGGHTPGSSFVLVQREGERIVIVGDAVHCPIEITNPSFEPRFDVDERRAAAVRADIRDLALQPDTLIAAPHFPAMRLARFVEVDGGIQWRPVAR